MTLEEAEKIAATVSQADGGCSHCARELAESLQSKFPEFDWWAMVAKAGGYESP